MSRRRKNKHEEHRNHEAWAIPYGDLITLLLAFFVVMYSISSINAGKYRVLSDSLYAAFRGTPRTMEPIQIGQKQVGDGADVKMTLVQQAVLKGEPRSLRAPIPLKALMPKMPQEQMPAGEFEVARAGAVQSVAAAQAAAQSKVLEAVADKVMRALDQLVRAKLVFVRRKASLVEVEIRTDILFPSGSATLAPTARPVIARLAKVLAPFPNPIRVEGFTDDRPIATVAFPSNWELSAARAASVVQMFASSGVDPQRLSVIGHAQYEPIASNATAAGRNANRRVAIVILAEDGSVHKSVEPVTPAGAPHGTVRAP